MTDDQDDGIVVATITITRTMYADDLLDDILAVDGNGEPMPLVEALGMLRLGEHTLIRKVYAPDDDGEDPDS